MLRRVAAPLAILAFWCGMAAAAHAYPAGYDWCYQTISVLLYTDHNPKGFAWAWAGLWEWVSCAALSACLLALWYRGSTRAATQLE